MVRDNLASVFKEMGRTEELEALLVETLRRVREFQGEENWRVALAEQNVARVERARGAWRAAKRRYALSEAILRRDYGPDHAWALCAAMDRAVCQDLLEPGSAAAAFDSLDVLIPPQLAASRRLFDLRLEQAAGDLRAAGRAPTALLLAKWQAAAGEACKMNGRNDITRLLADLRAGRRGAFDELMPLLYDVLHTMAAQRVASAGGGRTLAPTGLVHEAYLRLVDQTRLAWQDRDHFLATCSVVMRNLVIDFVRHRSALRRGGPGEHLTLDENLIALDDQADELIALDQALDKLEAIDPRLCRVVECRFFAGLGYAEIAAALDSSERTVRRDWLKAKGILLHLLND